MHERRKVRGRRSRVRLLTAGVLVAFSAWFVLSEPLGEGPLVLYVTAGHGVDAADLAVLPLLALAGWLTLPRRLESSAL